jgi:hypothetical protein
MAEAAVVGANRNRAQQNEEDTLLQIPLSEFALEQRLKLTIETSEAKKEGNLLVNCANLVIVLLGLVTKPENYLLKCYDRDAITEMAELDTIVKEAFSKANVKYKGQVYNGISSNQVTNEITRDLVYSQILNTLGVKLKPGYATPLGMTFREGNQHLVLLRKDVAGNLELIDPQVVDRNGSYPLRRKIYPYFNLSPYKKLLKNIIHFVGPILPMSKHNIAKSNYSEAIMHLVGKQGGKRKTRRQCRTKKRQSGK